MGIDRSDLVPNAARRIQSRVGSRIPPHQNGDAAGWRTRKIARRQRQINHGLADPDSILISEKSALRTLIQHHRQHYLRSISLRTVYQTPLIALLELPACQHRLAERGKIARAHSFLD